MKMTVIVPTYRRTKDLARCLQALKQQKCPADEILVVVRDTDQDTWKFLEAFDFAPLPLKTLAVTRTGVVAAMNRGLDAASGEIISFTDDDAAPHTDWLERIRAQFLMDERVAGVGGRDAIQRTEPWFVGTQEVVGRLQWYGRLIGNHHLGTGCAREVDVLKGVNMSFRRAAIGELNFDERMLGTGAQVHFEVAFCLTLKRQGWKLIYDPAIAVDHYIATRFDEDQRDQFNAIAFFNEVHNETLALLEHLSPLNRIIFLVWAILIGTRRAFGIMQWLRFTPREGSLAWQKLMVSIRGRWQGWIAWRHYARERTSPSSNSTPHKSYN
jgi:cellulose synthase/poly-beta-1,6-N-acetylglucosamine synthase-like glycosyltransferase